MKKNKKTKKAKKPKTPVKGKALSKKAVRKKRIRTAKALFGWIIFVAVLLVILAVSASFLDPWEDVGEIFGTVAGFHKNRPQDITTRLVVELDSGPTVTVGGWTDKSVLKGDRVVVLEKATRLLGRKGYRFLRIVPGDKPKTPDNMQENSVENNG